MTALRARLPAFGVTALVLFAMLWPERGYVPVWDGRVYSNCVIEAAASGLSMESLRCAGHPTQGWAILLALPQSLAPGDVRLLHLADFVLALLALVAVRAVLARVFPSPALARELDVVALACAVHPIVLSTLVQVNIDFGVYVFFFASLAALLNGLNGWALLAGTLLCFSKETGVLAYALAAGLAAAFRAAEPGTRAERVRRVLAMWPVALPPVLFAAHVLQWNATHREGAVWKHTWQTGTMAGFNFFDLSEPVFLSYAAGLFVLGFMWVAWTIVAADGLIGLARIARRLPSRDVAGADRRWLAYVTILTALLTYILTSFRTWSNLRYFALLYPLFVILAYAALLRLRAAPVVRRGTLALLVVLFLVSDYRSVDPLARAIYGTFDIGERRMYDMASITGEFDGPGRDQIVYNLEFTGFHHVQNALFASIRPNDSTVIATPRLVRWNIWSQLDTLTRERMLRRTGVLVPRYADEVDVQAMRAREAWFLDFSNRPANDRSLERLSPLYREDRQVTVFSHGHKLVAHHLVRRVLP